ncbi:MFS transporter, partial [Micromonospora sp. 4G55]|uniref:MFS transporter n=1 Tax=Micromonospora sp. 4G55 TaxID=2806102 RepID=UPI001A50E93C
MPSLTVFYLIAVGQLVSLIGSGLTGFGMSLWVYQRTGSVSLFATATVLALLPAVVLSPIAGALADRWDRRLIMIIADCLAATGTVSLALLLWLGQLQLWHVFTAITVTAVATAFQQPAYLAAVTQLVPKRYYGRANGIVSLGTATSTVLAPLVGGALVIAVGLRGIVVIDLLTFAFAVAVTLSVRFPDTLFVRREEPFRREVLGGWRFITRRHGLVALVVLTASLNYFFAMVEVLVTPLTLSFGDPAVLGRVLAASGVGMLVGAVVMGVWGGTARRTTGILASVVLLGASLLTVGLHPSPLFPAVGLFGMGLATALVNTHWLAIVQAKVGLELQGRVLAMGQMLSWLMVPAGFLSAGPLAEHVFAPLVSPDGVLAAVVGTGPGRGMALRGDRRRTLLARARRRRHRLPADPRRRGRAARQHPRQHRPRRQGPPPGGRRPGAGAGQERRSTAGRQDREGRVGARWSPVSAPTRPAGPTRRSTGRRATPATAVVDCLHRMVAAQAARTPEAEALRYGDRALSYRELDEAANRLARVLLQRGVAREERVGVCLPRTPELVVALLAVLKAGACYVPLDPAYPPARVAFMTADSGVRLVLTRADLADRFPDTALPVDRLDPGGDGTDPAVAATPADLAYVIYTSGSTGRPKGVAIEHRSASVLMHWVRQTFDDTELGGTLAATSVCFDLSIFEIFGPLCWGGRVLLVDDVLALAAAGADRLPVTLVNTVPSAMSELLTADALPASVRTVCLAGEPLTAALAARVWSRRHVRRLCNLYGPSEDTTYSTWAEVPPDSGDPPIGRPLPQTRAYLLDADGQPVPPGEPGELHLAGAGLARGYLDR